MRVYVGKVDRGGGEGKVKNKRKSWVRIDVVIIASFIGKGHTCVVNRTVQSISIVDDINLRIIISLQLSYDY